MKQQDRLTKIRTKMTPKQLALLYLKECQELGSSHDYLNHLAKTPLDSWPERKTKERVGESINRGIIDVDQIRSAMQHGELEVTFLRELQHQTGTLVARKVNGFDLYVRLFGSLIEALLFMETSPRSNSSDLTQQAITLKIIITTWLLETYAIVESVSVIEKKYFEGHLILFQDVNKLLQDKVERLERVANFFNETVDSCTIEARQIEELLEDGDTLFRLGIKIDVTGTKGITGNIVKAQVLDLVEGAKIAALASVGKMDEAKRLWDGWIESHSDNNSTDLVS